MRPFLKQSALLLLIGSIAACQSQPPVTREDAKPAPLAAARGRGPTKLAQVDLFPNGVGFFEFQGMVDGNSRQQLRFRSGQIDDVLGSLVFQDTGGGRVGQATFPTREPLSVTLHGLQVNLGGNPSLADILGQFRGDLVTLIMDTPKPERISGRIIDVHQTLAATPMVWPPGPGPALGRTIGSRTAPVRPVWFINLYTHGHILSIALGAVKNVHLASARRQRSFSRALNALARQSNPHQRRLTLWFHGKSRRMVRFAYLLETPLWRITYRLIVPPGPASPQSHDQAVLQAFAIVSNQTDMNWRHIRLHLQGGRPISFIDDLYRPLYLPRPVAMAPSGVSFRPQTYGRAWQPVTVLRKFALHAVAGKGRLVGALEQNALEKRVIMHHVLALRQNVAQFNPLQGVQTMAQAGHTHPAFDYHVADVTIPRQQSAMVPILVAPIQGRPLDLYVAGGVAGHPLQSMQLTNNTGKYLLAGPLSVVCEDTYGGAVQLGNMDRGQKRIISFAVDQSVKVKPLPWKNTTVLVSAKIRRGMLYLVQDCTNQAGYMIVNRAATARTVLIRQNLMPGWKIVMPIQHPKTHHGLDQFELTVAATATGKLPIVQTQQQTQPVSLTNLNRQALRQLIRMPHLPAAIITVLKRAVALRKIVWQQQRALAATGDRESRVLGYQAQLRDNLLALNKTGKVYQAMAVELQRQEEQLQKLHTIAAAERASLKAAQDNLASFWKMTNVAETFARKGK